MTELQFVPFLLYMPLPAVPSSGWRWRELPASQGLISAQATGVLHGAPSLGLGPASHHHLLPGAWANHGFPRHLLHLHPSKGLCQAVLVGPLLIHLPCLFPSSPSTNLVTRHNCFKLRHSFIQASKASQADFALIVHLIQHLLSCHGVSVSEHLGEGTERGTT